MESRLFIGFNIDFFVCISFEEQVRKIIEEKHKKPVIGWKEWEKLDSIELERGKVLQKLREKILSPQEALELLKEKLG